MIDRSIFNRRLLWLLGALGLLILGVTAVSVSPVLAQDQTVTDDEVNEVAKDLFCPVCESTPLDVCPTQACADWRELIRTKLAEGQTKEEIHEYFANQYGDGVLADPPKRGFNLILWSFPVVAVIVGGFLFSRYLRTLRDSDDAAAVPDAGETAVSPPPSTTDPDDYLARVESELQKR